MIETMSGRGNPTHNWNCQRKPKQWNSIDTNICEYNSGKHEILS